MNATTVFLAAIAVGVWLTFFEVMAGARQANRRLERLESLLSSDRSKPS